MNTQTDKNAPIGIFDSGLGGLSAVRAVKRFLPQEDIVYFGDTARVPYGSRSRETLLEYAEQDIRFLLTKNVKAVLIACNTADSMTRTAMERIFDIPITGVVLPAAKLAAETTENGKLGVIATSATISTGIYEHLIHRYKPDADVFSEATPLLVPLIEDGRIHKTDEVTVDILREYLAPMKKRGIDTLVLGCTHYPLIASLIGDMLPDVKLIDTGFAAVHDLTALLSGADLFADREEPGQIRYYVSDGPENFARNGGMFIGEDITGKVKKITL